MEIQWFPGHMLKTQRLIQEHKDKIDVFVEVVDARAPISTANPLLSDLMGAKPRVVVLNKIDLADPHANGEWKRWLGAQERTRAVLISCKERKNLSAIFDAACDLCKSQKWFSLRRVRGMIVGVPNVGKSSLINVLSGAKKASVAPKPGHTRGLQKINVSDRFDLLDTPGILWHKFDEMKMGHRLAFLGSIKDEILSLSDLVALLLRELSEKYAKILEAYFGGSCPFDDDEATFAFLEAWGKKRGMLAKAGEVNWDRAFQTIVTDFRTGKMGRMSLEFPPPSDPQALTSD